ncbi:unnamed protein product [Candidula unifasciata]|uniref:Fucosyltransferase n=1 Tax=Candidula unifasciata TaxID=100452 RepID=A0A8S3Z9M2_9EUPU|nr:unnamed protein product [Candidula unifasciata]
MGFIIDSFCYFWQEQTRMSLKAVFVTLLAFCLLGIFINYFATISSVSLWLVDRSHIELNMLKLFLPSNDGNATEKESTVNRENSESVVSSVKKNSTISKFNSTFKSDTPEVFPSTTTMTFNTSLVVQCKESPFIECVPQTITPLSKKVFNIVYFKPPDWESPQNYKLNYCHINTNQCRISGGPVTSETDVVIIYGAHLRDNIKPPKRWPNQTYILSNWEPPMHVHSDFLKNENSPWNAHINLIMTYRLDADVFIPYSHLKFRPKPLEQRPDYYKIAQNKTKTAMWIVSKCSTPNKRWEYVKEMQVNQKYIDVDIGGACGHPCSRSHLNCDNWATEYKFYLSFENSHCKDYVTEKFFKLFEQNVHVIPVVRGSADYNKYFPEFTFINTADFKTAKDLALHLKHLASDLQTYSKYLEYIDLYLKSPNIDHLCGICSFVQTHELPASKAYNLRRWINDNHCYNPTDI